ncbi:hypothetical protein AS026_27040 [Rhizobium altiplani]|uniref:Uncharacterized protein n=1 Tax=Rhizobium altiplani TaxID=1864509 RepID=A0A125QAB1_9HYPH|nr:hypothetical protein AS026_27040 [Rhizobium altiplani]
MIRSVPAVEWIDAIHLRLQEGGQRRPSSIHAVAIKHKLTIAVILGLAEQSASVALIGGTGKFQRSGQ